MRTTATTAGLASLLTGLFLSAGHPAAAGEPDAASVRDGLRRAVTFFHQQVAVEGGYVYQYSGDLELREGEGIVGPRTIWVQPPGTPAVGLALLDAYEWSGERVCLEAARDAGQALIRGQLRSGGWYYRIEFESEARQSFLYRVDGAGDGGRRAITPQDRQSPGGWQVWRQRRFRGNVSTLDDDTTQAAVRFLARLDRALDYGDPQVHEAARYALDSLTRGQYPIGGWSANFDRFPVCSPDVGTYPIRDASWPATWSERWPKDFRGCYVLNDHLTANMIATMLVAYDVYGDSRYLASAARAGDFLRRAQLPAPQAAWAQQYDRDMHPVWDRAFEPPAISGLESQSAMEALMALFEATGETRFLEPIPAAIAYFRRSQLEEGQLARFYAMRTNEPIYFTRNQDGGHVLTYERRRLATNYAFVVPSRLDRLADRYERLRDGVLSPPAAAAPDDEVQEILDSLDARGAWVETGRLRHHRLEPESGIIDSATFARNIRVLARALRTRDEQKWRGTSRRRRK